jgi:hypothetical protein
MTQPNPYIALAHVRLKDRDCCVYVSMNTLTHCLHMFKYDQYQCQYQWFADHCEAEDWLAQPLPTVKPGHY